MKSSWPRILVILLGLPVSLMADMVTLIPARDNTLFEDQTGSLSNGIGQYLFTGRSIQPDNRRALLAFDLSSIPAGSAIDGATLTLHMSRTITGDSAIEVHRVSRDWGEGTSNAIGQEGEGAAATLGDATWMHNFFNNSPWTTPGGDFDPVASAVTPVGGTGFYAWSSPRLLQDVQGWLKSPSTNFGWVMIGDELEAPSAKRFDSREHPNSAYRPTLTVSFTAVPEPATGVLVSIAFLIGHHRRKARIRAR